MRGLAPDSWFPDGRTLLLFTLDLVGATGWNLNTLTPEREQVDLLLEAPGNQTYPRVSPNGQWLAYSDALGTGQVRVASFPDVTSQSVVVSTGNNNSAAMWSSDGRELFYRDYNAGLWGIHLTGPM